MIHCLTGRCEAVAQLTALPITFKLWHMSLVDFYETVTYSVIPEIVICEVIACFTSPDFIVFYCLFYLFMAQ